MTRYQSLSECFSWGIRVLCFVLTFLLCGCNEGQPYPKKAVSFSTLLQGSSGCVGISYRDAPGGRLLSFRKIGSSWKLEQQLDLRDYGRSLRSGISLSFNDQFLSVGADAPKKKPGEVLLFSREDRGWKYLRSIAAPQIDQNGMMSNRFGAALAFSGNNHLFCGAPWARTNGLVYVFDVASESDKMIQRIKPVDSTEFGYFGGSVAFSDGTLIVGAKSVNNSFRSSDLASKAVGAAYIYEFRSGRWVAIQSLQDALIQEGVSFLELGTHVDIYGEDVVITDRKSAYIFSRNKQGRWEYVQAIEAKHGGVTAVSLTDDLLAISLGQDIAVYRRESVNKWSIVSVIQKDPKSATSISLSADAGMSLLVGASDMYAFSDFDTTVGKTQARLALYELRGETLEDIFEIKYLKTGVHQAGLE